MVAGDGLIAFGLPDPKEGGAEQDAQVQPVELRSGAYCLG